MRKKTTRPTAAEQAHDAGEKRANMARARTLAEEKKPAMRFSPPAIAPGVVPAGEQPAIAMDYAPGIYDFAGAYMPEDFVGFQGYPHLSMLATRAEYRAMADTLATELTREWITIKSTQEDGGSGGQDAVRLQELEAAIEKRNLRGVFAAAAKHDCFFGRAQIAISIKGADNDVPLVLSKNTVTRGSLDSLRPVEAMWTTPSAYNSTDPTAIDFYQPREWFMLGRRIHASRLLTIITRPLPDIIKPAYNFSGMSLSQLAEPYVNNWLRTRQSVSDLINNFSITALKTNMGQVLQGEGDGSDVFARADMFTLTRSNRGLMLLDNEQEEIVQVNTPLSGLHELQAQAQEHMCAVSRIPSMLLTGISPTGMNASSEGEIRAFYDWIRAQQEAYWRKPLEICIKLIMLDIWGEIDDTITFEFNPLWQLSDIDKATLREKDSNTICALIDRSVIGTEEARKRLASDPNSGFAGIDVTEVPEAEAGDPLDLGGPFAHGENGGAWQG